MRAFADEVRRARSRRHGQAVRAIVHIGIGGSDLGPRLVWEALQAAGRRRSSCASPPTSTPPRSPQALAGLDPAADPGGGRLQDLHHPGDPDQRRGRARPGCAAALGDGRRRPARGRLRRPRRGRRRSGSPPTRCSASGTGWAGAIRCGRRWASPAPSRWASRLSNGCWRAPRPWTTTSAHAPLAANAPVLLALAHVFNRNGLDRPVRAVVPYAQRLRLLAGLPAAAGDGIQRQAGDAPTAGRWPSATATAVFGDAGTNGQHAFFQLLHQGTDVDPGGHRRGRASRRGRPGRPQTKLLANAIAQAEALMVGRSRGRGPRRTRRQRRAAAEIAALAPAAHLPRRPAVQLPPAGAAGRRERLGALIALYEHKTFVEGVLWGINSFDQWGVELGKTLATRVLAELEGGAGGRRTIRRPPR